MPKTSKKPTPLNRFQRKALRDYGSGWYRSYRFRTMNAIETHEKQGGGDTLFLFVMRELQDATSTRAAIDLMKSAVDDLNAVVRSLEKLQRGWSF